MIGLDPDVIFRVAGDKADINRDALNNPDAFTPCDSAPLIALRQLIAESAVAQSAQLPPMAAGVFGYLGYDMVRHMERLPEPNPDALGVPDARKGEQPFAFVVLADGELAPGVEAGLAARGHALQAAPYDGALGHEHAIELVDGGPAAGGTLAAAVKVNIYLTDLAHFTKVNEVMARYFPQPYPARAAVGVAALATATRNASISRRISG